MGKIVSKKEFGELIGKSPRWISKLIEDGLPTAGGGGRGVEVQIDSEAAISWLIAREVRREMGEEGDDEDGLNSASTEDRLLKKARREKLQIEIDTARGRLLPADTVAQILVSVAAVYATQLDALPSRCAADLAVIDDPATIRARVFEETRRIRAATADRLERRASDFAADLDEIDRASGEDGPGAAASDG
ncbi:Phage DNA packaging protein Nu1 [Pseudomonas aeruginosa]|uniref:Phage DNA packaging protein Nu1 n=1 Tax=Pseudomonas aeruginosa TaxID=287 RepID=A0A9P1RBD0_PSEAI|nr:terminase small subunit [Pseudomonas aeruginosa]CRP86189.1 Phage DNA packaging protein Nu1 [Pseudomonas aeruginosa]